ncbi:MAG: hypothetical protein ACRC9T_06900, partial [Vibrionaceae bacterium]
MLPNDVKNTTNTSHRASASIAASPLASQQTTRQPNIVRVNGLTREVIQTAQAILSAQPEAGNVNQPLGRDEACLRSEYLQELLLQYFCPADDEARDEIKLEPGLQLYEASPDGACMFRCFLAAITRNSAWLSSYNV